MDLMALRKPRQTLQSHLVNDFPPRASWVAVSSPGLINTREKPPVLCIIRIIIVLCIVLCIAFSYVTRPKSLCIMYYIMYYMYYVLYCILY